MRFGTLLREARLEKGLTLEEVAALIDWTPQKMENMENGKRRINWHRLAQLLRFYEKDVVINLVEKNGAN